ncbi:hypothetical protein [Prevotella sp. 10(H)]|uniref:hypothetical protein n=1 Tax=Prevotella sp. 10(H) TaxID=1158294 RepID=UPI0004A6D9C8|nr:hypothetical protein [Prevotella sp. 10(H)]
MKSMRLLVLVLSVFLCSFQASAGYDKDKEQGELITLNDSASHEAQCSHVSSHNNATNCICNAASGFVSCSQIYNTQMNVNCFWNWNESSISSVKMILKYTIQLQQYSREETVYKGNNNFVIKFPHFMPEEEGYVEAFIYCPTHNKVAAGTFTTFRTPIP